MRELFFRRVPQGGGTYRRDRPVTAFVRTREVPMLEGHSGGVSSARYSRDGTQILSGSMDSTVKLWNADSGMLIRTFEGHSNWVWSVAFSPDSKRVLPGGPEAI